MGLTIADVVPAEVAHAGDLIGFTRAGRPIFLPGGGSEDADFDTDMTGGGQDDEEDGDDGDDGAGDDQEALREELAKTKAALRKANKEAERARRKAREQEKRPESDGEARNGDDGTSDMRVKRLAGIAALAGEGLSRAQAKVAVRMMNLDDVEVDDDGDGDFDDAIAELKEAFPGLFRKQDADDDDDRPAVRRRPRVSTGNRQQASKPKSSAERIAASLVGAR